MKQIKKFEIIFPFILLILFLIGTSVVSAYFDADKPKKQQQYRDTITQSDLDFWGIPLEVQDSYVPSDDSIQEEESYFWGISPYFIDHK